MKKLIILLILIIVVIFIIFIRSKNNDSNIIGNPNFEASFLYVTSNNFVTEIENTAAEMNLSLSVVTNIEGIYIINDIYTINYSEGFLRMFFKKEDDKISAIDMIELLVRTFETSDSDIDFIMQEVINSENAEELFSGEYAMCSIVNRYDFDITEDKGYEFHVEDARMGY